MFLFELSKLLFCNHPCFHVFCSLIFLPWTLSPFGRPEAKYRHVHYDVLDHHHAHMLRLRAESLVYVRVKQYLARSFGPSPQALMPVRTGRWVRPPILDCIVDVTG